MSVANLVSQLSSQAHADLMLAQEAQASRYRELVLAMCDRGSELSYSSGSYLKTLSPEEQEELVALMRSLGIGAGEVDSDIANAARFREAVEEAKRSDKAAKACRDVSAIQADLLGAQDAAEVIAELAQRDVAVFRAELGSAHKAREEQLKTQRRLERDRGRMSALWADWMNE